MPPLRVLVVELESVLALDVAQRLTALGAEVTSAGAAGLVERLVAEPPELAIVNVELSQGSGFGLVNRALRMEALRGLRIVLVAENSTEDALDMHRQGPTPAAAYVRRPGNSSTSAFADAVLDAAKSVLARQLPEVDAGDLVEIERREAANSIDAPDPLAAIIGELGGYRVLRRLRDEDGGAVFACMDEELKRVVAIKLMGAGDDRERLLRFQRERRILALLHSPHVVTVYGAGTHKNTPYLVRELIDGESLAEQIAREGPLDVPLALKRVRETALGLKAAAAAGVIHRDVRPENIHVVDGQTKLARFGMGRREGPDEVRITRTGLPLQDVTYVAPERMRGEEDARGDIYALGVTLHTLIAGAPPFTKAVPVDVLTGRLIDKPIPLDTARPGTPPTIAALVSRLMAEDPAQRPQDYDQVLALMDDAARAMNQTQPAPEPEPTAVHGTLRLMSVVEIVQSLELAKKTATVALPSTDEPEGKLAFDAGKLVYASCGDQRGEDAFFTLVARLRGAFRVQYEPITLERNIEAPITGLLLEAARRADHASRAPGPAGLAAPAPPPDTTDAELLAFASEPTPGAFTKTSSAPPARPPRQVSTRVGFAALAVLVAGVLYGSAQLPAVVPLLSAASDDDGSGAATAALLAKTRAQLEEARARLATDQPRLATFEAAQASVELVGAVTRQRAAAVQADLEAALKPELTAGKFTLRRSEDGGEVIVEIDEVALFSGDSDDVNADGKTALARIAGAIAPMGDLHVRVEGHTDDGDPRARHKNQWGASGAMAMAVAKVMTQQGLTASSVKAVALADTVPLVPNKGPRGRARNRRVELHLLPQVDAASDH